MTTNTLTWTNLLGLLLIVALVALLTIVLVQAHHALLNGVGWRELASVGWVTTPG